MPVMDDRAFAQGVPQESGGWCGLPEPVLSAATTNSFYRCSKNILIYSLPALSDICAEMTGLKSSGDDHMGDTNQDLANSDAMDDFFDPMVTEMADDDYAPFTTEKQRLAAKRRRAEQRLEQRRLREELGDYDLELEDY